MSINVQYRSGAINTVISGAGRIPFIMVEMAMSVIIRVNIEPFGDNKIMMIDWEFR